MNDIMVPPECESSRPSSFPDGRRGHFGFADRKCSACGAWLCRAHREGEGRRVYCLNGCQKDVSFVVLLDLLYEASAPLSEAVVRGWTARERALALSWVRTVTALGSAAGVPPAHVTQALLQAGSAERGDLIPFEKVLPPTPEPPSPAPSQAQSLTVEDLDFLGVFPREMDAAEDLLDALIQRGQRVPRESLLAWNEDQREEAWRWVSRGGTEDVPEHVKRAAQTYQACADLIQRMDEVTACSSIRSGLLLASGALRYVAGIDRRQVTREGLRALLDEILI